MDEPTNHLDMESIESLNTALDSYKGTLIFVSHDREFVSSLATRIIEIRPDGRSSTTAAPTTNTSPAKASNQPKVSLCETACGDPKSSHSICQDSEDRNRLQTSRSAPSLFEPFQQGLVKHFRFNRLADEVVHPAVKHCALSSAKTFAVIARMGFSACRGVAESAALHRGHPKAASACPSGSGRSCALAFSHGLTARPPPDRPPARHPRAASGRFRD